MRKEMGAMATFNIDVSVGIFEGGAGSDVFNFFTDMPYFLDAVRPNFIEGGAGNDNFYCN
jgi:hypothetical protein